MTNTTNVDWSFLFNDLSLLFIYLAPVAHGKTLLLRELILHYPGPWVYVSPLKALALEVFQRFHQEFQRDHQLTVVYLKRSMLKYEGKEIWKQLQKKERFLLVVTEHQWHSQLIMWMNQLPRRPLVVWDEFHLLEYWGQDFRPGLWEMFLDFASADLTVLGLTATLDHEHRQLMMEGEYQCAFDHRVLFSLGNHVLRYPPEKIYYFFSSQQKRLRRVFHREVIKIKYDRHLNKSTFLFFCRTRNQVDAMVELYSKYGFCVLGCKGGEVDAFLEQLQENPHPQIIFATTCLSHGVNLPPIGKVFFFYVVGNLDYWIQMVGRGGRQGQPYQVYTLDSFVLNSRFSRWKLFFQKVINYLWTT